MVVTKTNQYNTMTFSDIFDSEDTFLSEYHDIGLGEPIEDDNASILYILLYGRYGNSPIASSDINQFKARLFGIVFQYGPTWEKKLELQKTIRALEDDDLQNGGKNIYNKALNPGTEPSTGDIDELDYINEQNVTNVRRSYVEGLAYQIDLLEEDVTEQFLVKFKKLFKVFVAPEKVLEYITSDDEGDL